jgi:hypothetical protein
MLGTIILFFIVRVSIPVAIGFGVHEALKGKLGKWAPGAAAHSAYVAHVVSGILLGLVRGGHVNMSTWEIMLLLVAIAGLVWLLVQPSLPAALLIMARHGYALVVLLLGLGRVFQYFNFWSLIFTLAAFAFSILPIVFLIPPVKENV